MSAFDGAKTTTSTVKVTFIPGTKLTVTGGSAIAGTPINITVSLAGLSGVASLQFDLDSSMVLTTNSVTAGIAATNAGKSVSSSMVGNDLRVLVSGVNQTVISTGPVALINLQVPVTQASGSVPLNLLNVAASDPSGIAVAMAASGSSTVVVSANQAPVVTPGASQTATLPAAATITATATDDGAPNPPGAITYTWSVL